MSQPESTSPQLFNCPSCGAPQKYNGGDTKTISCSYCGQSIIVPENLRTPQIIRVPAASPTQPASGMFSSAKPAQTNPWRTGAPVLVTVVILAVLGFFLRAPLTQMLTQANLGNAIPQPARVDLAFGGTGTGEGLFQDAKLIAVDDDGVIYIADKTKRVQVFDAKGKFLHAWMIEGQDIFNTNFDPRALAADRNGHLYVLSILSIRKYDAATGKQLDSIGSPQLGELFYSMAIAPDGKLVVLSEVVTDEQLLFFDTNGNLVNRIAKPIGSQFPGVHTVSLSDEVAVDGLGNLFVLNDDPTDGAFVYLLSPQGKYISRFGGSGEGNGQFNVPRLLAIDNQSRIYVGDQHRIQRFDAQGRWLDAFPASLAGNYVYGMALDKTNAMLVIGWENRIYKLVPNE